MGSDGQLLVVCGDKSIGLGLKILDMSTGEDLLHLPNCASPSSGLICLRGQFIAASQINRHGSVGGGAIGIWALNKPQQPLWSYPLEAIGPLSCTKDGTYLAGGAFSGNAYLWDVTSGKLLKTWRAHAKTLNRVLFSDDDSLLISSSDDGMICVWSLISLLDVEGTGSSLSLLHSWSAHESTITGLLTTSGNYFPVLVSSSLDGTCKVWDFISGRLVQSLVHHLAITSIFLYQGEGILFYGSVNGHVIGKKLDVGVEEEPSSIASDQLLELKGHSGTITALTSGQAGLISASEDNTICIWDVINLTVIQRIDVEKGKITNLVVVQRSSMLSTSNHRRASNQYTVSSLDKYPQLINSSKEKGTTTLHSLECPQQMSDGQKVNMPVDMAMQMKVETSMENRVWATKMAKHVMDINKYLQSCLLDLMQQRLFEKDTKRMAKKKTRVQS
ncbi:protein ROOT INITIATION DEFECTIVE 3-like [Prosopis cineraria]|uniref:protein ROOT INITIATION DEFECTIVE 3-like n=1 Tax=Prosopis cineraria TaxID=364024 RepID=UPI00240EFAF4|nr:protein ROOT INITIATION DEFECTIVE 3-like [Prosopis cineraria]XP_054807734.1 protein ROOT INITIATION DEFECTIVE 3-like [Prosopis cineraria]